MTPQEKNVFGKLFTKTKLTTQKIDLSIIDDLQNASNLLNSRRLELNDFVSSYVKSKNDANNKKTELLKVMENFDSIIKKANAAASSLGIEITGIEKFTSLFKESQNSLDNFKSNVK